MRRAQGIPRPRGKSPIAAERGPRRIGHIEMGRVPCKARGSASSPPARPPVPDRVRSISYPLSERPERSLQSQVNQRNLNERISNNVTTQQSRRGDDHPVDHQCIWTVRDAPRAAGRGAGPGRPGGGTRSVTWSKSADPPAGTLLAAVGAGELPVALGAHPDLRDLDDVADPKFTVDFRRVYAAVLERWLSCPATKVLPGAFEPMPVLQP
jgi:hypothetical protein